MRGLASLPAPVLRRIVGRPVIVDGLQLHPETQLALKLLELARAPELKDLNASQARERVAHDAHTFEGPKVPVDRVEELGLAGAAGRLRARHYVPSRAQIEPPGEGDPLLVYFHGGGFVVGDLDTHDNVCRFLATTAEVRVIAVDYRLAPENPFPAAIEDAVAAVGDIISRAAELRIDPHRLAVGGDSAGGNLAAGVAQATAAGNGPGVAFQLLFYPWVDLAEKRRSYSLFREGFYLTESDLDWYRNHYVSGNGDVLDPRCSPLLAEDLAGVAPAYIATAGFDPLRDEGEEYATRLLAAGVAVALRRQTGLIHGFANTVSVGRVGREALIEAAGALRMSLAPRGEETQGRPAAEAAAAQAK